MPDVAKVLKEEIQRIAKKEVKAATTGLHKDTVQLKRTAADLKRRVAKLERDNRRLVAGAERNRQAAIETTGDEVGKARITAKAIRTTRAKLGLSQAEFAKLLDVNPQTVYQWEHKEGRLTFRGTVKSRIVEARKLTPVDAQKRIEAVKKVPEKRKRRKR